MKIQEVILKAMAGQLKWRELIVIMDDATSEIYHAQLVEAESTHSVMVALREVI